MKETSFISSIDFRTAYYSDPELSHAGQSQVEKLRPLFLKKLQGEKPIVCASGLLRAQQTAYGLTHAKSIYIAPHICEVGVGLDNTPLSKSKQEDILKEICHEELISHRNFDYYSSTDKSNFSKFKKWFGKHWSILSKNNPSRLFLFFSHGNFIKSLPGVSKLSRVKNCECYEFSFTITNEIVTNVQYVGKFEYADLSAPDILLDCLMDTCRKPSCLQWNAVRVPTSKRCSILSARVTRKKKRI
jgi:broad specificity phosphatase PhoE